MRSFPKVLISLVSAFVILSCGGSTPEPQKPDAETVSLEQLRPIQNPGKYQDIKLRTTGYLVLEAQLWYKDKAKDNSWICLNVFGFYEDSSLQRGIVAFSVPKNPRGECPISSAGMPHKVSVDGEVRWVSEFGPFIVHEPYKGLGLSGQWAFFITKYISVN
jgi:hypothetical protein